ncbi:RNA polymerase sigma factor [Spirillospora sp. CA-294931]|uniref:RNA polymerase sigma factor n=1 Tax=Spirillospora sp. CA-294931 TaxID=3240042 RepID=UPI003D8B6E37
MPRWTSFDTAADRRLVHGLNEGDEESLAALYDSYAERLYDYILSLSGEHKVAADIVHDTFIDASRRAARMRGQVMLRSWLYGAARRRCVQRGRARELYWDQDAEEHATSEGALLNSSLARLDFADQELLLLTVRHDLHPAELGATLGLSPRRAGQRADRARARVENAIGAELARTAERCAEGPAPARPDEPEVIEDAPRRRQTAYASRRRFLPGRGGASYDRAALERHRDDCLDCRRLGGIGTRDLLTLAPAPVLPAALRHRVMHTATDPELAGYRSDIAARGGGLTPDGLPSQPDKASPFTKRWLLTGSGMACTLGVTLLVVLLMGTGIAPGPDITLPFEGSPKPSVTDLPEHARRPSGDSPDGRAAPSSPGHTSGVPPVNPQQSGKPVPPSTPGVPPTSPPPSQSPPKRGVLTVDRAKVTMYGTKTAKVTLAAEGGTVTWTGGSSTDKLSLSPNQGTLAAGQTLVVTITLKAALVNLPGEGSVYFSAPGSDARHVKVVWGITLL